MNNDLPCEHSVHKTSFVEDFLWCFFLIAAATLLSSHQQHHIYCACTNKSDHGTITNHKPTTCDSD